MTGRVEDKVCIVTGAGRGIGRTAALMLAAEGARVLLTDVDEAALQETLGAAREAGSEVACVRHDVSIEEDWVRVCDEAVERFGALDVLVNNAGICPLKPIEEFTLEEFRQVSRVNAFGTFLGCRQAVLTMRQLAGDEETPVGSIINVSSVMGQVGLAGGVAYCATKGAVRILTKSVAIECGERRELIRVNSIHPGTVRTPMTEQLFPDIWREGHEVFANVPMQTYSDAEDIGWGIVFLASDESAFMNGAELNIDGGYVAA